MSQENQIPNRRAFDNWKVVGPTPRTFAFIVDGTITALLVMFGLYLTKKPFQYSQFFYLWVLILWAWEGFWLTLTGTTPGRRPFGISVYSPRTDGVPHPIQVCLRILTFWMSVLLLGAGLTPIFFRRDRRGWHDLISETLTVGKEKDLPTPFAQKFGQSLLLLQSLTVFSTFGALLLSTGTGHMSSSSEAAISCENKELLLKKTPEVLLALTISPAWHECFPRLLSALGPISDSQLARTAQIATKYFELWTHSSSVRSQFYAKEIQAKEDDLCNGPKSFEDVCKTVRSLASVTVGAETNGLGWLSQYEEIARTMSAETQARKRVDYLTDALKKYKDPIIVSAIYDRIWSEELAMGLHPSQNLDETANSQWVSKQACWLKAMGFDSEYTCAKNDLTEAVDSLNSLTKGADFKDVRDKISRLDLGDSEPEFNLLLEAWQDKEAAAFDKVNEKLNTISYVSPLRSIAAKFQD